MTISITERDPEREAAIIRTLRGQRPRGIILAASRTAEPAARSLALEIEALTSLGSRVVVMGRGMPDLRSVAIDNFGGARSLGQAFAGLDDIPTSSDVTPAMTTVRVPLEEMGAHALRAVVDGHWDPAASEVKLEVMIRDSTPPLE